jgi:hypothetical protein
MKKTDKDDLVAAVAFVLSEVVRLQAVLRDGGLAALPSEDAMHWLPDARENGFHILCGKEASKRIASLAAHAGRAAGVIGQVENRLLDEQVRTLISRRFVGEKRSVTLREVERVLSEAGRLAAAECSARTHFIPCHLVFVQDPVHFAIGPVRFLTKALFRSRLAHRIWASRAELRGKHHFLRDIKGYYGSFGWVAEIDIADCDQKTSSARALDVATRAIDCLHLLIGPGHSRKMRVGGPDLARDLRGSVSANADGLRYVVSFPTAGHVGFEKGWYAQFELARSRELVLCALALEAAVNPGLRRPLSDRFIDAIHWFGEAVRDPNPAARVVKYITALERMLMTEGRNEAIAPTIAERVAALCCERGSVVSYAQWRADAQTAYALRSKLVHGSLSSKSPRVMDELGTVARVSQHAIIGALKLLGERGLTDGAASSAKLKRIYDGFVADVRADLGLDAA